MIFTICQLFEKSWEHRAKSFITFSDLKKAYDSVPRSAIWLALRKFGVPENTIKLIHTFHQGIEVRIHLDRALLEEFSVENGLRQGCCMVPVLFKFYTYLVMECWQARVEDIGGVGVILRYNYDHKLLMQYTRNAVERKVTGCFFADDGVLLASTRSSAERTLRVYQAVHRVWPHGVYSQVHALGNRKRDSG